MRVTILSDMIVSRWTHAEWGFSSLVEVKTQSGWKKNLFDTGAEPTTVFSNLDRMTKMQNFKDAAGKPVSLCDIDTVVLSHNHQDHTMGLVELRRRCKSSNANALATTYVGGPEIFWKRPYSANHPSSTGRSDDNVMVPGNGIGKALGLDAGYDKHGLKEIYETLGGHFILPPDHQPMEIAGVPGGRLRS